MPPYSPQKSPPTLLDRILRTLITAGLILLICAILAAVFVPKFGHSTHGEAKLYFAKLDLSTIQSALDTFSQDIGRYPTTKEGLESLVTNPNLPNWKGPYIKKLPNDPWGNPYSYYPTYTLSSYGPDKLPHTPDDITPQ